MQRALCLDCSSATTCTKITSCEEKRGNVVILCLDHEFNHQRCLWQWQKIFQSRLLLNIDIQQHELNKPWFEQSISWFTPFHGNLPSNHGWTLERSGGIPKIRTGSFAALSTSKGFPDYPKSEPVLQAPLWREKTTGKSAKVHDFQGLNFVQLKNWLVVSNMNFIFHFIYGMSDVILPIDFHI